MSKDKEKITKSLSIKSPRATLKDMKEDSKSVKGTVRNAVRLSNYAPTPTSKLIVFLLGIILPIIVVTVFFIIIVGGSVGIMTVFISQDKEIALNSEKVNSESGGGNQSLDRLNGNIPSHLKGKFLLTWNLDYITSLQTPNRCIGGSCSSHKGIDFQPSGSRRGSNSKFPEEKYLYIYPMYPGEVVAATSDYKTKPFISSTYGNVVVLRHDIDGVFYYTLYAHLQKAYVKEGDVVDFKNKIGLMGCTGRSAGSGLLGCGGHLHFEIRNNEFRDSSNKFNWSKGEMQIADLITCSETTTLKKAVGSQYSCIEYTEKVLGGKPSELQ